MEDRAGRIKRSGRDEESIRTEEVCYLQIRCGAGRRSAGSFTYASSPPCSPWGQDITYLPFGGGKGGALVCGLGETAGREKRVGREESWRRWSSGGGPETLAAGRELGSW